MAGLADSVQLRTVEPDDQELLYSIYASTRTQELSHTDWNDSQKTAFLRMQFDAQDQYYKSEYENPQFQIILFAGEPAGRLYLHPRPTEIRIMDITLLPAFRRKGIGTFLLKQILSQASAQNKSVTIHVEIFNPALRLYERLGFAKKADRGVYHLMEWSHGTGTKP